jgi:hypothetical protein
MADHVPPVAEDQRVVQTGNSSRRWQTRPRRTLARLLFWDPALRLGRATGGPARSGRTGE